MLSRILHWDVLDDIDEIKPDVREEEPEVTTEPFRGDWKYMFLFTYPEYTDEDASDEQIYKRYMDEIDYSLNAYADRHSVSVIPIDEVQRIFSGEKLPQSTKDFGLICFDAPRKKLPLVLLVILAECPKHALNISVSGDGKGKVISHAFAVYSGDVMTSTERYIATRAAHEIGMLSNWEIDSEEANRFTEKLRLRRLKHIPDVK
jgi:hypothetical protein